MEHNDDHPQDAFELGRAAAAKLKEHDEELSHQLPHALQTLFSDTEFQDAIVVSGVVTNQRQTLTPIASYSYNAVDAPSHNPATSTSRMLTRRGQQQQMERSQSISPQKSYALLESSTRSRRTVAQIGVELEDDETKDDEEEERIKPSKSRRMGHNFNPELEQVVEEEGEASTDKNNQQIQSSSQAAPHLALLGDMDNRVENPCGGAGTHQNQDEQQPEGNCMCCNDPLQESTGNLDSSKLALLRDLLWLALGMKKFYNKASSSFPFCDSCTSKISKLSDICTQVGRLEDEFNEVRGSLCEGIISRHLEMTEAVDNVAPHQKGSLQAKVLKRMRNGYSKILPGNQLLKEASQYLQSSSKDAGANQPNQNNSGEDNDNELNEDEGEEAEVFECRFCDKIFRSKAPLTTHEQKIHKIKGKLKCNICDKDFSTKKTLEMHILKHEKERSHKCNLCPKSFQTKTALSQHSLRHLNFKKFECKICPENTIKFFTIGHLNAHFVKRHPGKDPAKNTKRLSLPNTNVVQPQQPPEIVITGL